MLSPVKENSSPKNSGEAVGCIWGFAIVVGLFVSPGVSYGLGDIKFGPEFTLLDMNGNEEGKSIFEDVLKVGNRMIAHLVDGQPEGAKFSRVAEGEKGDMAYFYSPNGWWFHHHIEGQTVEIRMSPGTVEHFRHFEADMQDAIFVSAANEGFFPALYRGGGHINVSSPEFNRNPLLFRNFVVDLFNHNELFMGVFGYDTHNGLPMQMLPVATLKRVRDVIRDFDNGTYAQDEDIGRFGSDIQRALSANNDVFYAEWHVPGVLTSRHKFHAVYFGHLNYFNDKKTNRLELRAVRPQTRMNMWTRQIQLLDARIRYLDKVRNPIPLDFKVPMHELDVTVHKLNPPVDAQLALRAFYEYVSESGEKWADHRDYFWPQWIVDGELEKFEQSDWYRTQENKSISKPVSCEDELAKVS